MCSSPGRGFGIAGLYHHGPGLNAEEMNQGQVTYFTYLDNQQSFEAIGARDGSEATITGRGEPERGETLAVTASLLPLLRVRPLLGQFIAAEDDRPGSPKRAVLSYGYWQRQFGGARDVVGQRIEIDGVRVDIAGVLPESFRFLRTHPAVLLPMQLNRAEGRFVSFGFQAIGRLKPGVSFAQANADVARMIPLVEQVHRSPNFPTRSIAAVLALLLLFAWAGLAQKKTVHVREYKRKDGTWYVPMTGRRRIVACGIGTPLFS